MTVILNKGYQWETVPDNNGDIDVMPIGEEHIHGAKCICEPRVVVCGVNLVIVHSAYDGREVIEQAVEFMNEAQG
jgi:hypothetical protein